MQTTDTTVAQQHQAEGSGNPSLKQLVERHSHAVFRLAFRLTGNEEDAEDVVQESFIKVYRKLDTFEERSEIGTWIYRVVANTAIDHLRRRNRLSARHTSLEEALEFGRQPVSPTPSPERIALGSQIGERVRHALDALSDIERAAFVLRHDQGCSSSEIAEILDLTTSASKHAVFRAVKKLRRLLGSVAETASGL